MSNAPQSPSAAAPLGTLDAVSYRLGVGSARRIEALDGDCERILGVTREQLLAAGLDLWRGRIPAVSRRRNRGALRQALARRERFVLAYRLRDPDGARRWVAESGIGRWDSAGRLVAIEGLVVDLSDMARLLGLQQQVSTNMAALLAATDELAGIDDLALLCRRAVELARERLGMERCGLFLLEPDGQTFRGTFGTDLHRQTTDERASVVSAPLMLAALAPTRSRADRLWHRALEQPFEWRGQAGEPLDGPPVWVVLTPLQTGRLSVGFMANDRAISRGPLDEGQQDLLAVYCALLAGLIERQQAAEALRRHQAEYRDMVSNSANALAFVQVDSDDLGQPGEARILMANERCQAIAGVGRLDGRRLDDVFPPDQWPLIALFWPVVQDGQPRRAEIDLPAVGRVYAVTAFRPRAGCFALSLSDVTESRRHAQEQQLNQARLDALLALNQMADADDRELCLFALEQGVALTGSRFGYLAFTNEDETVLTMHSWSQAAMDGCEVANVSFDYPLASTGLWGEPVRQRRVVISNAYSLDDPLAKGTPAGHVPITRHMGVPIFDGERIVAVCGVANKAEPYADDDARQLSLLMGGMWRVLGRQRAEEALRRAQAELRRSEERYRMLFDHAPIGIIQYDADGVLERANDAFCRLVGAAAEQLVGMRLLDHPDAAIRDGAARVLAGHTHRFEGEQQTTLSGKPVQVRTLSHPLRHEDGSLLGGMTMAEDISERLQLEERLRQSSKMEAVGRLAGGVAHDFNNLLTTIVGYTELALAGMHARDPLRRDLEAISRAAERANGLTRQLLAFSRRQVLSLELVDLNRLVRDMMAMLRPLLGEDIELCLDLAADLATTKINPGGFEQVLMNLCVNARDAMPDGGQLAIATRNAQVAPDQIAHAPADHDGRYVVLTVRDTGVGMDEATRALIFEPFFTTKPQSKGTGLGLATTYGIVHQSQGWITVESATGQGATFSVYLPASTEAATPSPAPTAPGPGPAGPAGAGLILLVEDQVEVRVLARRILENHGYQVIEAEDGVAALAALSGLPQPPDLLMTDVIMPRMGGAELATELRQARPGLPVLFVSGYTDNALARLGAAEAGTAFLPKPFAPSAVIATVRRLLDEAAGA
ncbi:MAG: GAF domain-containing protein [Armatimonadetes bacterium]|nr:GAF domain-containing protein [Armatimonadota bacterium]